VEIHAGQQAGASLNGVLMCDRKIRDRSLELCAIGARTAERVL
jgi:hypothetical protein